MATELRSLALQVTGWSLSSCEAEGPWPMLLELLDTSLAALARLLPLPRWALAFLSRSLFLRCQCSSACLLRRMASVFLVRLCFRSQALCLFRAILTWSAMLMSRGR